MPPGEFNYITLAAYALFPVFLIVLVVGVRRQIKLLDRGDKAGASASAPVAQPDAVRDLKRIVQKHALHPAVRLYFRRIVETDEGFAIQFREGDRLALLRQDDSGEWLVSAWSPEAAPAPVAEALPTFASALDYLRTSTPEPPATVV